MSTAATNDLYRLSRNIYSDPAGVLSELETLRLPKRLPIGAARLAILRRLPFTAGNLHAPEYVSPFAAEGRLPRDWSGTFYRDIRRGSAYVVYSYGTPIAWERADGLRTIPHVTYSVSTAHHQAEARTAWDMAWGKEYSHPTRSMAEI